MHCNLFIISMKREIYKELLKWKADANRKPLMLLGARQVGKEWMENVPLYALTAYLSQKQTQ